MDVGILGTGGKGELWRGRDCRFEATGRENGEEFGRSVLGGVWQLVSLKSNSCTCMVWCCWFWTNHVLGQVKGLEDQSEVRTSRVAFCGTNLVRNSVTPCWEMLRAESVRMSPNWKRPSKSWRDGRRSSICRWRCDARCTVQRTNTAFAGSFFGCAGNTKEAAQHDSSRHT